MHLDGAGHLGRLPQRLGLEHQHVGSGAQRQVRRAAAVEAGGLALVEAARPHDVGRALAAAGVARVVAELSSRGGSVRNDRPRYHAPRSQAR